MAETEYVRCLVLARVLELDPGLHRVERVMAFVVDGVGVDVEGEDETSTAGGGHPIVDPDHVLLFAEVVDTVHEDALLAILVGDMGDVEDLDPGRVPEAIPSVLVDLVPVPVHSLDRAPERVLAPAPVQFHIPLILGLAEVGVGHALLAEKGEAGAIAGMTFETAGLGPLHPPNIKDVHSGSYGFLGRIIVCISLQYTLKYMILYLFTAYRVIIC
jgi:hypothetical protein